MKPDKKADHIDVKIKAATFRSALVDCNPALRAWIDAGAERLALRLVGTSSKLVNTDAAREYAYAVIAELVMKKYL